MGKACFWNDASRSAVVLQGSSGDVVSIAHVDDPHVMPVVQQIVIGFTFNEGEFGDAMRAAEAAAMPSRKKEAMRLAKSRVLLRKMREEGYVLAKPGSLEYAFASCLFSGLA